VQSFEQGWKDIPPHIEREMMLLLALKMSAGTDRRPRACWDVKNCPDEWRNNCLVWELKATHFCWYLNGTYCHGELQKSWEAKIHLCRECEVFDEMFPLRQIKSKPQKHKGYLELSIAQRGNLKPHKHRIHQWL